MGRRECWIKSAPELVRLNRMVPGKWNFYFPGFRSAPPKRWEVERVKSFTYRVRAAGLDKARDFENLAQVRGFIASQYEYLPANP